MQVQLLQQRTRPTQAVIDRAPFLLVVAAKPAAKSALPSYAEFPYGDWLARRLGELPKAGRDKPQRFDLPNARATRVACASCAVDAEAFERLTLARRLVALLMPFEPDEVAVITLGFDDATTERMVEALVSALLAANAVLPDYRREPAARGGLRRIRWLGAHAAPGFRRSFAEAEGNALARYLTLLPPNDLTPGAYRKRLEQLAREQGWRATFLDVSTLRRRKAGAFLSVVRGSAVADAGIMYLSYRPERARGTVALVGKGICYDTGGVNLKPFKHMYGMHGDMQGSAVALGTLLALSRLRVPFRIDAWLALATNQIGARACVPNEVVAAADGTTIEIVHTDAEGRMVLADTLVFASRTQPDLIIDFATLTGSCINAIGTAYAGVFSNQRDWLQALIEVGRASGERVWPFPQDQDFAEPLDSAIADVKQCAVEDGIDHILAACFLARFVKHEVPWLHVDLSAAERKGGLAHVPTDATGFGVRYTCALLLDHPKLWRRAAAGGGTRPVR
ncbi:MAG: leucyl aminopeptidase family protein [Gammaproteobacteria bacterium]|nr:leucyl aminopeptidase family protein [Gammaproteobacteria bacterium]